MLAILALLLHALVLGGPADRLLTHSAWVTRFPRTAMRLWHTCALAFFAALAAVLLLAAHDMWEHGLVWLFNADEPQVHAAYAGFFPAERVEGIADAALLTLLTGTGTLSVLAGRRFVRLRREWAGHRLAADALATSHPGGLRVLDHAAPAAFCVPGAGDQGRIVLTTGAFRLLSPEQLAATVEHERAHLRQRHHRAILIADVVTAAVGWTGLLRHYSRQIRRLAEMAADDQAAARHGRRTVATALLEMCTAAGAEGRPGGVAPAVAMTGPDPAERIRRLISGPPVTARRGPLPAVALCVGAALLALPPVVSLAPAAAVAGSALSENYCRN